MLRIFGILVIVLLAALAIPFTLDNSGPVTLAYGPFSWEGPLALVLAMAAGTGVVLGLLASLPTLMRLRREAGRLRRQVSVTQQEVTNLRSLPIKDNL